MNYGNWPYHSRCDVCEKQATYFVQWVAGGPTEKKCGDHAPIVQFNNMMGPSPYYSLTLSTWTPMIPESS